MLPDDITPRDLPSSARNELKTLSKENAERVARFLAMAARLIDDDPDLAHEHAAAAVRHAGRIGLARETLAITAYAKGDFALALRELRTYRRITGGNEHIALIVDSERGVGRPERALEEGRAADRDALPVSVRVELAIAMSGARLDLGQPELALHELDIPELDPDRAFAWSPGLFAARANVLEDLGRVEEAETWRMRAEVAERAIDDQTAGDDLVVIDDTDTEPVADAGTAAEAAPEIEAQEPTAAPTALVPADVDRDEPESEAPAGRAGIDPDDEGPAETDGDAFDTASVDDPARTESADAVLASVAIESVETDIATDASVAPTVEDEVAELLAEAGVSDDEGEDEDGAVPSQE